ncbi:nitronate monooxygenase family protein [Dehalobacter sp. DCM]|uniref:NAD(P)H-dependent flavin oxidoreductase n=1 Tax=Dehalobacter sp. DCM TaxID=2907827 RepID=UPI0030819ABB|nr:nitronate monooxygenase family protein [Dehalobacter sp. DCM]
MKLYFKPLVIGDLIAKIPIVQGGMGVGVSGVGLATAVANEGGIGVLSAAAVGFKEKDFVTNNTEANIRALIKDIQSAKERSKGIIGLNIMVALSNFADMAKTAIKEKIDIIFAGAGLPLNLPSFLQEGDKTKLVPIVSSRRALNIIAKKWYRNYNYIPDAVVVEGPKAGGHLGFSYEQLSDPAYSLENILVDVVEEAKLLEEKYGKTIPVIAGGGVYDGKDIRRIIDLGAASVQMATRFVATKECDASDEFKQLYLNSTKEQITIIKSPVGMPGRAIRNDFISAVEAGEKVPFRCPVHCITQCDYKSSPYCIALALISAQKGNMRNGFAFAGENAYRIDKITTVKDLMTSLTKDYNNTFVE